MLKSLKIKNFRCFKEFELQQLGQVNLFVGHNNCGKTSILEAVHILKSLEPSPFLDAARRREKSLRKIEKNTIDSISHFCFGHQFFRKTEICITGNTNDGEIIFRLFQEDKPVIDVSSTRYFGQNVVFSWNTFDGIEHYLYESSLHPSNVIEMLDELHYKQAKKQNAFIALNSSSSDNLINRFNEIVITPQEEILYEALRFIEPNIRRIAPMENGSFMVAIDNQRIPISSMGDGIWRMLEITLAMVNIPGGTLLIDEIDTGLHFSVMLDLWRLICRTAEKLDIQVFATTHSSDCWKSLAEVAQSNEFPETEITIHRIEKGKKASVVFNEQEMAIAAERDIEVR
jgi:AAA15 family ATPase/GTPase